MSRDPKSEGSAASPVPPEQGGDAAEELAYRLRQQQLAAQYGLFALKTHDLDALLQEATRACAEGLQSEFCKASEYLPGEGQFLVRAGVGWRPGIVGRARAGADIDSPAGFAFKTGRPVISNHLESESRFRTPAILLEHGVKRAINVLIQGDTEQFGVLEVDSPVEGRFTEDDLAFMQGFANLLGVAIERQHAEEALRASEVQLKRAMEHQRVLTREISHRVKNSLGMVAALLNMHARTSTLSALRQGLSDAETRVHAIAQIHDRLWRSDDVETINLQEFMTGLCEQLKLSAPPGQTLNHEFAPVAIATDQAAPLGLLVNELVTNAFKYAYPQGAGDVRVVIARIDAERLRLDVSDRGVGLPSDFNVEASGSLGMKLIASLSLQLGGQAEWRDAKPGTRFVLDFVPRDSSAD
jgi:two-component sensor histidine kinase